MHDSAGRQRVLVTGARGFIGGALARHLHAAGWEVAGAGPREPASFPAGVAWRAYDLAADSIPDALLDGIDVVVHAAFVKRDYATNVAGSLRLLDAVTRRGARAVFLSSLAAHERALSQYGRQKLAIERAYEARGALVVRPGLVLGPGGLFASLCAYLRGSRIVPLFGGGKQPLQTVFVGDLTAAIARAIDEDLRGTFTVAEWQPVPYRTFYEALCAQLGVRVRFVPVPFWLADAAVRVAGALRVPLPVDRDNLLGLRAMESDTGPRLAAPDVPERNYRENLRLALAGTLSL